MASKKGRFSAGTIMLQVVPSLRGMEEAIDDGARKIRERYAKAQGEAAEEGGKRAAAAQERANKKILDSDRKVEEQRQKWAAEDTKRREKAAKEYANWWGKALDDVDAAERKAEEARAKADRERETRQQRLAREAREYEAAERAAAEKLAADRRRWAAEETARNEKAAKEYADFWTKTLDDIDAKEEKVRQDAAKDYVNWWTGALNERQKLEDDARKKEEKARDAARRKEEQAQERALAKQAAIERSFREALNRASVRSQVPLKIISDEDHQRLAEGIQRSLRGKKFDIEVRPDGNVFQRELADVFARVQALREVEVGVDMDAKQFNMEWAAVMARLKVLDAQKVDVEVGADAGALLMQLSAANAMMQSTQREAVKTEAATRAAGSGAGSAANSFRAMNGYLLAAVAIGPLLIPILASIGGLLVGIAAGAIGVGLAVGTMVLGLMGIGEAVTAMSKADKEARQRAAQSGFESGRPRPSTQYRDLRAERSRALALRDARERVADARENAPKAIDDALRRQESAERSLIDAQKQAKRAQEDLNEARRQAKRDIEDLNFAVRGADLSEQQAAYDLQRAGIRYNAVLEDDQATARERDEARIAYEQAQLRHEQMLVDNQRLREEAATANKVGVEGSDRVVEAKERIADANENVIEAERNVADAQRNVAEVRVEQAERIADAERALTELIEDQRLQRLAAAESAVASATAVDKFSTANFELGEAMRDLSPAGREFATWLYGLKPLLDTLKFTVQETFLPGLQAGMQTLIDTYGPGFIDFVGEMGTALGDGAVKVAEWLTGPEMQGFFATLAEYGPQWFGQFLDIVMGFSEGAFLIFEQLAPFATQLGDAIVLLAQSFADWAASEEGQKMISEFIGYLIETGPEVWQLFASAVGAMVNLFIALAPYADALMSFFTTIFDAIAGMDPADLAMIVGGVMALVAAFQAFFIIMAVVTTVAVALAAGISGIAIVIALVVAALVGLVVFMAANWPRIKQWFSDLYAKYIKPVVDKIAEAWNWLYDNVLSPIWEGIKTGLDAVGTAATILYNVWVIWIGLLGALWEGLYKEHIAPVVDWIKGALKDVGSWIETHLKPRWEAALAALGAIWNALSEAAKTPIRFILETVINKGIVDNFNNFAKNFPGTIEVPHVSVPSWLQPAKYATGTSNVVLPGYTPGRDVHRFVSPTGGVIDLSGGEGILRPEVVRALGPDWVERVNAAARGSGTVGVLRHLGGYADGGVLGAIGNAVGGAAAALSSVVGTVMEFVKDPKKALETAVKALLGDWQTDNAFGSLILSVPKAIIDAAAKYVRSIFTSDVIEKSELGTIDKNPVSGTAGGWANPSFGRITSRWGPRTLFGNSFHAGTDIAGGGAVYAAASGKVLHAGLVNPFVAPGRSGSVVQILHNDGTVTWYGHMLPKNMLVSKGDAVRAGQRIGRQGDLGNVTGVHLHYETHPGQDKGKGVNPETFMRARGINLGVGPIATSSGSGGTRPLLYDDGGYLQPGLTLVNNLTGKPEPVLTAEQKQALDAATSRNMGRSPLDGATFYSYDPRDIMDEYEERRRREAALAGLGTIEVMVP